MVPAPSFLAMACLFLSAMQVTAFIIPRPFNALRARETERCTSAQRERGVCEPCSADTKCEIYCPETTTPVCDVPNGLCHCVDRAQERLNRLKTQYCNKDIEPDGDKKSLAVKIDLDEIKGHATNFCENVAPVQIEAGTPPVDSRSRQDMPKNVHFTVRWIEGCEVEGRYQNVRDPLGGNERFDNDLDTRCVRLLTENWSQCVADDGKSVGGFRQAGCLSYGTGPSGV